MISMSGVTDIKTTAYGGHVASSSGYDIIFRDSNGTSGLYHEIESYDGSTGTLVAWVKVPTVSGTADKTIYMYYGNACVLSGTTNTSSVWDSNFKGVWHLHGNFEDSTSTNNDGANFGTTNVTGEIADGDDFDGTSAYIQTPSSELKTANSLTVGFWLKADATDYAHHMIWEGQSAANGWGEDPDYGAEQEMHISLGHVYWDEFGSQYVEESNKLSFFLGDTDTGESADVLDITTDFSDTSGWHYVVATVSNLSTSPTATLFLNGVPVGSNTGTTTRTSRVAVGNNESAFWKAWGR